MQRTILWILAAVLILPVLFARPATADSPTTQEAVFFVR